MNNWRTRTLESLIRYAGLMLLIVSSGGYAADNDRGAQIYKTTCSACHDAGVGGAPRISEFEDWRQRTKVRSDLVKQVIAGKGAMPPRGGNQKLSDADIDLAVGHMLDAVAGSGRGPAVANTKSSSKPLLSTTPARLAELRDNTVYHKPPLDKDIPHDKYGDDVRFGKRIFTQTWRYARRYSGNDLACSNCHLDSGRRPHSAPLWAAFGMYPAYKKKSDRNVTLEERIQQCFRFSMNGIAPALDAPEIRALKSYSHFLARGAPAGLELPGRGYPQIIHTGQDPNPTRGSVTYKKKCANCHGASGEGQKKDDGGYTFPPLWGIGSYNKGAGMARDPILAGFIKANMPLGQEWSLTDQEALDLAAFINLQLRPWDPRKGVIQGILE